MLLDAHTPFTEIKQPTVYLWEKQKWPSLSDSLLVRPWANESGGLALRLQNKRETREVNVQDSFYMIWQFVQAATYPTVLIFIMMTAIITCLFTSERFLRLFLVCGMYSKWSALLRYTGSRLVTEDSNQSSSGSSNASVVRPNWCTCTLQPEDVEVGIGLTVVILLSFFNIRVIHCGLRCSERPWCIIHTFVRPE